MESFGVNTQELRGIATELENILGSEYDRVIASINQHAQDISGKWRGEAQRAFEARMRETDDHLKEMRALVASYAEFLRTTAAKYDQTDQEATDIMQRFNA